MDELGIGSRIRHPEFGVGVIINVKPKTYITVFTERGKIEVAKSYQNIEVIDAQPAADALSRSTSRVGGGSAFFVRRLRAHDLSTYPY